MAKKHLVLVVDDSPTVRRLVTLALSQGGYEVITAENGEEGLKIAKREEPSVILVDFVMPKMNGFEFCKNVRADSRLSSIPIVLTTSKGKDVGKGFEENFGISHYLQKPFKPETLMKILKDVLSGKEKKSRSRSDSVSEKCPSDIWENISKELTTLLKSAVIQTLRESDLVRSPGRFLSGEIMYFSVANILKFAAVSGISGRLSIFTDTVNAELYLENGEVAFASMSRPGSKACLEELIVKDGASPSAEIISCLAEAGCSSLTAGSLLLERGLITEDALSEYYRHLSEDAVHEALSATSGHFSIEDVPLPEVVRRVKREKKQPA
jgi:DNA-binding response OmpR family regulator